MMIVKINDDTFETGTGSIYSYQEVKNAVYGQLKRGFKMKDTCIGDVICIKFNYDTWEIEFYDRYYIVIGEYISKRFIDKEKAKEWANRMRYLHGISCEIHKITKSNLMLEEELLFQKIERRDMMQKRREC